MATIIDELIVLLKLDSAPFVKGRADQKKALADMRADAQTTEVEIGRLLRTSSRKRTDEQIREMASLRAKREEQRKTIRELERDQKRQGEESKKGAEQTKKHGESIGEMKAQLVGLFAVLTAGKGLVDFFNDTVSSSAAVGRFAKNIGVATDDLSAWQIVVEENGGTAADAIGTLQALAQAYQDVNIRGDLSKAGDFQGLGISLADLKDPLLVLQKLQDAQKRMSAAEFTNRATAIGIAPGAIAALQGAPLGGALDAARQKATTEYDSDAAKRLQKALVDLKASSTKLGRGILVDLSPQLERLGDLLLKLADWADRHADAVEGAFIGIGVAVVGMAIAMAAPLAPFLALAAAAAALGAAINEAYDNSPELQAALRDLDEAAKPLKDSFSDLGEAIGDAFGADNFDAMKTFTAFLTNSVDAIAAAIRTVNALLQGDWRAAWAGAKDFNRAMADDLTDGSVRENARPRGAAPGSRNPPGRGAMNIVKGLFTGLGYSEHAARGIVAGMYAESRMDPRNVNPTSGAYGIGQWLGSRKALLFKRYGDHPSFGQQLAFMQWELTHTEKAAGDAIRAAPSESAGANAYIRQYMRPAPGRETSGDLSRAARALAQMGSPPAGAQVAAARHGGGAGVRTSTSHVETNVDKVVIHTAATDAEGIARTIPSALKRSFVPNSSLGMTS